MLSHQTARERWLSNPPEEQELLGLAGALFPGFNQQITHGDKTRQEPPEHHPRPQQALVGGARGLGLSLALGSTWRTATVSQADGAGRGKQEQGQAAREGSSHPIHCSCFASTPPLEPSLGGFLSPGRLSSPWRTFSFSFPPPPPSAATAKRNSPGASSLPCWRSPTPTPRSWPRHALAFIFIRQLHTQLTVAPACPPFPAAGCSAAASGCSQPSPEPRGRL